MAKTRNRTQISGITGLTPRREQACDLLAAGDKTAAVGRTKTRHFSLAAVRSLFCLMDETITAIRESLNFSNESVKLKAATYMTDTSQDIGIRGTDMVEAISAEATYADNWNFAEDTFHEKKYKVKIKASGNRGAGLQKRPTIVLGVMTVRQYKNNSSNRSNHERYNPIYTRRA